MNLFPMFQKAQRYFIAERKYLFNVMRPDMDDVFPITGSNSRRQLHNKLEIELVHPKQLENFTTRMLFILIKLFKFTSYFFLNIQIYLKQSKTNFLGLQEISLLIKIVRFKFKEFLGLLEECACPSNFKSILKNLSRCYWRFYEGSIKRDVEAMGGLNEYVGVLDNIVASSVKTLH